MTTTQLYKWQKCSMLWTVVEILGENVDISSKNNYIMFLSLLFLISQVFAGLDFTVCEVGRSVPLSASSSESLALCDSSNIELV